MKFLDWFKNDSRLPRPPVVGVTEIDVIQQSTVVKNNDIAALVSAAQSAHDDTGYGFGKVWNTSIHLNFVTSPKLASPLHWWLVIADNSDQVGALGYHELNPKGLPIGFAFAATCQQDGVSWTVDATHELWEMLVDPYIDLCAISPDEKLWAYEVGDPVESDASGYTVRGVRISDWVTPAFFQSGSTAIRFDRTGQVSGPFTDAPNGYHSFLDLNNVQAGWQQVFGDKVPAGRQAVSPLSRRGRKESKGTWTNTALT